MTISLTQSAANADIGTSVSSLAITLSQPVAIGDVIVVMQKDFLVGGTSVTVTDDVGGGNTYTESAGNEVADPSGGWSRAFYAVSAAAGTSCVATLHFAAATAFVAAMACVLEGCSAAPYDGGFTTYQQFVGTSPDVLNSGDITTTNTGDFILGFCLNDNGDAGAIDAGTGFTQQINQPVPDAYALEFLTQSVAGSIAATFTPATDSEYFTGVLAFSPAASVGTGVVVTHIAGRGAGW